MNLEIVLFLLEENSVNLLNFASDFRCENFVRLLYLEMKGKGQISVLSLRNDISSAKIEH